MILLDYGHGKDTPGKRCKGLHEWRFNRQVGRYLELELDSRNINYHVLVPGDDDIGLRTRVELANYIDHDLLISIHGNAFSDPAVSGIETFYYSRAGRMAADIFQKHLIQRTGWKDRGIKKGNFYIIKKSPKPAILTENGFYTNDNEREKMKDPHWQFEIAFAHADAIEEYLQ